MGSACEPEWLNIVTVSVLAELQLLAEELSAIESELKRTAIDRTAVMQAEADMYMQGAHIDACGMVAPRPVSPWHLQVSSSTVASQPPRCLPHWAAEGRTGSYAPLIVSITYD